MKTLLAIGAVLAYLVAIISNELLIQVIASVTSIVVALITLKKVNKVSKDVNGHMTNLLNLTEAKGKREGKAEEKQEQGK